MSALLAKSPPENTDSDDSDSSVMPSAHPLALLATGGSLFVAMLAGMASLNGVVQGFGWLFTLWLPLLLVHGAGAVVRGSRLPSWLAPIASALVIMLVLGFHPTLQDPSLGNTWFARFTQILEDATLEFATQVPEVAFTRAVDFAFLILGLVLALLVEGLASVRRLAGLVVLPLSFAPVLASLFKLSGAGTGYLVVLLLALICYFSFLPYAWPTRYTSALPSRGRMRMVTGLALLTTVVLVAASSWMPGFRQGMLPEGSRPSGELFASNLDPLLNLGRDLRSNNTATAFTYFTSSDQAPYLRTLVISNLDADRWEPDPDPLTRTFSGTTPLRDSYRAFAAKSVYTEMDWEKAPRDQQLPLPTNSYLIEGIVGSWNWEPLTSVARFTTDSREATRQVRISHSELEMDADLARNFSHFQQLSPGVEPSLSELPPDTDGALQQLLQENLDLAYAKHGSVKTVFDRAVAIQDYLRSAHFSYSEQTPLREGYDGANLKVITAFLDRRAGYCVHFASTMAMMARAADIPSRVVIGYAPGDPTGETRNSPSSTDSAHPASAMPSESELTGYRVSGQQAHAWPELYLPGLGWTPFEPTPGRGVTPEYAPALEADPVEAIPPEDLPETPEEQVPSAPVPTGDIEQTPVSTPEGSSVPLPRLLSWVLLPLLVLSGALPAWYRRRERGRNLAQLKLGGEQAAQVLWQEIQLTGADYAHPLKAGQSEADYCAMLSVIVPEQRTRLSRLAQVIEDSFYAMRHPDQRQASTLREDLAQLRHALKQQASLARRVRATVLPAKLSKQQRDTQRLDAS